MGESTTTRRRRWRWIAGLALVAVLIGLYLYYRLDSGLRSAIAKLDASDPGWQLDPLLEARDSVAEEANSARVVMSAANLIPKGWPPPNSGEINEGVSPAQRMSRADYQRLCDEMGQCPDVLEVARKLVDLPHGQHKLVVIRPIVINTLLDDQQRTRGVARVLQYAAIRGAEEGNVSRALADCRACVNAGRSLGDEPFLISQFIRTACVAITFKPIERILAQGTASDAELKLVQTLLEDEDAFPMLHVALRGERAAAHEMFLGMETQQIPLSALGGAPPAAFQQIIAIVQQPVFKAEHPLMLELMTNYVESARKPPHEWMSGSEIDAQIRALPATAVLTRLLLPAMGKATDSFRRRHVQLRTLILCLALERYRLAHGSWPAKLDELVPEQLQMLPVDPYDGTPLHYRRWRDGVVVYSGGPDGTFDGDFEREKLDPLSMQMGFRLWDVARRRQDAPHER